MGEKILICLLFVTLMVGLGAALQWSLSLPIVVKSWGEGNVICALDSNGKKIPIESVGDRYHLEYNLICPADTF